MDMMDSRVWIFNTSLSLFIFVSRERGLELKSFPRDAGREVLLMGAVVVLEREMNVVDPCFDGGAESKVSTSSSSDSMASTQFSIAAKLLDKLKPKLIPA